METATGTTTLYRGDSEDTHHRAGRFYAFTAEVAAEYGETVTSITVNLDGMEIVTLAEAYDLLGETDTARFGMILTDTNNVQWLLNQGIDAVLVDDENDWGTEHQSLLVLDVDAVALGGN